jgi:hypothetical protein
MNSTVIPLLSGLPFCNEKGGLITKVVSLEGDNLVVFYYFIAFETWPDKPVFGRTVFIRRTTVLR